MSAVRCVAIIPARGSSKRFPRKNLHPLRGKPLLSYPIAAAKGARRVDRVIVSTEDSEIAAAAKRYGAEVPFLRPAELAEDHSSSIEVAVHAVGELERLGYRPDYTVLLQPTTPLVTSAQIDAAVELALEKDADSVVSVAEVSSVNHPYNIRQIQPDGTIRFWQYDLHYEYYAKRPRPPFYRAANLWVTWYRTLMEERLLEGKKNFPLVVDPISSLDVDYPSDLDLIEAYLQLQERKKLDVSPNP